MEATIDGWCDDAFIGVSETFAANFAERGEVGAAVAVIVGGREVVNLFGGWASHATGRPWRSDTLVDFYSVGKPIVGLLALQLVDAGMIGLDDPIASVWPEYATGGKENTTVRQALCHRAGVPAIREPLTNDDLWDWDRMTSALAATHAWWTPGARHAYHTNTYGHLIGEIVRRVSGEMPGSRLRSVTSPLEADVCFGVPDLDQPRCAEVIFDTRGAREAGSSGIGPDPEGMVSLGYFNPPGYSSLGVVNSAPWRRAQIPSTNGHGTALGIARIYAALLEPGRLLSPELLDEATRIQSQGFCPVLGEETSFGLGFKPTTPRRPFGPLPRSFGHFGTGGAVGFADPDAGVAFGYVMNHVIPRWQSSRNRALVEAVYRVV
jgi:CubicO group peptidase (beta-lactamase class C family)